MIFFVCFILIKHDFYIFIFFFPSLLIIQKYIQDNPKDKIQNIKIALDQMKPVINFIRISNKTIAECIKFINTLFNDQEAWSKGYYDLLFLISKLIFHIFAFGQLKVNQKSIMKDFEIVKDLLRNNNNSSVHMVLMCSSVLFH